VRAVTQTPPAKWPLSRRQEYLDWTEHVVAGLRGSNAELEKLYDQLLAEGRRVLRSGQAPSGGSSHEDVSEPSAYR
jgi:hypothetical protein